MIFCTFTYLLTNDKLNNPLMNGLLKNWKLLLIMILTGIFIEFLFDDLRPTLSDIFRTSLGSILIYVVVGSIGLATNKNHKQLQKQRA